MIMKMVEKDECLEMDTFIISQDQFILQFYNKNDIYFNNFVNCKVTFTNEFYKFYRITETSLNTINKYERPLYFRSNRDRKFSLKSIQMEDTQTYLITPQDFRTFLIENK